MRILATDIGGSHAACALLEEECILDQERAEIPAGYGLKPALEAIGDAFSDLLQKNGFSRRDVHGIAISFCGIVDPVRRRILSTNAKYEDAVTIDLDSWGQDRFQLPLRIENDARMALLGERFAGAAKGVNDLVTMTLGTGVGGAAMIDSRLLRGRHFQAGCLGGHLGSNWAGRRCTCNNIGCVEAEASTWALPAICRDHSKFSASALSKAPRIDFSVLFECAEMGDECAIEVLNQCIEVWASGIVSLIHAYDPDVVVVGGGVMKSAGFLLPRFKSYVDRHAWTPWGKVDIRATTLGDQAGLLGAVPLWMDESL